MQPTTGLFSQNKTNFDTKGGHYIFYHTLLPIMLRIVEYFEFRLIFVKINTQELN